MFLAGAPLGCPSLQAATRITQNSPRPQGSRLRVKTGPVDRISNRKFRLPKTVQNSNRTGTANMPEFQQQNSVGPVPCAEDVVPAASIIIKSRVLNSISYEILLDASSDIDCGDECCVFILPVKTANEGRKLALLRKVLEDEAVCLDSKTQRIWRLHIDAVTVLTKMSQLGYVVAGVTAEGKVGEIVHSWTLTAFDDKVVLYGNENNINEDSDNSQTLDNEDESTTNFVNINEAGYNYLTDSLNNNLQRHSSADNADYADGHLPLVDKELEDGGEKSDTGEGDDENESVGVKVARTSRLNEGSDTDEDYVPGANGHANKPAGRKRRKSIENGDRHSKNYAQATASPQSAHEVTARQFSENESNKTQTLVRSRGEAVQFAATNIDDLQLTKVRSNNIQIDGADVIIGRFPTLSFPTTKRLSLIRVDELVCKHLVHGRWLAFTTSLLHDLLSHGHDGCCYLTRAESKNRAGACVLPRNFVRSIYGLLLKAWQDVLLQDQLSGNRLRSLKPPNSVDFCAAITKFLSTQRARCSLHA